MDTLFNIAWALVAVLGLTAAVSLRRQLAPWKKAELYRDVVLLCLVVFLLFPIISISDDIGYFSYYFSGGQTPNGIFWVSAVRRNKQLPLLVPHQVVSFLIAASLTGVCQYVFFGQTTLRDPLPCSSRAVASANLRAPPFLA